MVIFNYGFTHFWNKVVLTKFINVCRMVWDLIWGTSCFYKSKTEEAKRWGKSAVQPILCCPPAITVVSTAPSSMLGACFKVGIGYYLSVCNINLQWLISQLYIRIHIINFCDEIKKNLNQLENRLQKSVKLEGCVKDA